MKKFIMIVVVMIFASVPFWEHQQAGASSTADRVIETGKSQLGTPYRWGGTTTRGFDCSGFTQYAFKSVGIDLPRTAAQQYQVGQRVSRSNLQPGDMVFFDTRGGPTHNGIYIGNNQFIHSASSRGVSIASLSNVYWNPRYIGARRVIQNQSQEVASVSSSTPSYEEVNVQVNGSGIDTDQAAILKNGRTLVPMRAIFEELGASVQWNSSSQTVSGTLNGQKVSLTIGSSTAYTSVTTVSLDQPAEIINGRTMVPLRFVGESLGASVDWNGSQQTAVIQH
ncbi:NlpC/P60 family protein [Alkalicoccus chagannorensis]|uniref:NlpC/P60 family protein n=1 Tax=Alkalicoccus chagannorensis TaxID=427072 RepID=UPI000A06087E|nr:NlpC/P60 family protein [Alkalicoccus chagannorensis]